jgi:peptide deformylase
MDPRLRGDDKMFMSIIPITIVPHPVLRQVSSPIEHIDDDVRRMVENLTDTFYDKPNGVGLAANQIGIARRFLIVDADRREDQDMRHPLVMINPEIIWASEERSVYMEGCFSIPEQYAEVERPALIRVKFQDISGQTHEIEREGALFNHVVQHEIDHLNGVLFIDYLSKMKRDIILRKVKRLTRYDDVDVM